MGDAFGRGEAAQASAGEEVVAPHEPVHDAGGVEVAGTGRVDHSTAGHRFHGHLDDIVAGEQHRAVRTAGDGCDLTVIADERDGRVERVDLVEALDLDVVGEEEIDRTFD